MAHSVCHFEVLADDIERAKNFYGDAFGWTFEAWGPPDFFVIRTGAESDPGITEGALTKRNEPVGGSTNGYRCTITVPDIEKAIANIKEAGGDITSAIFEIDHVGKVASFRDTENNDVAVMQYVSTDSRHVSA